MQTQNKHDKFLEDLDVKAILGQDVEANIDSDLPMRKWLYSWLLDPNIPGNFQSALDKWVSILIIVNLFTLMFEHVPAVFEPYQFWFQCFEKNKNFNLDLKDHNNCLRFIFATIGPLNHLENHFIYRICAKI
jgi:hypothetical protein